eukprot:1703955-Prymnesium_polylepis.1
MWVCAPRAVPCGVAACAARWLRLDQLDQQLKLRDARPNGSSGGLRTVEPSLLPARRRQLGSERDE